MNDNNKTILKGICSGTSVLMEMGTLGLFLENIKLEKQRTSKPYPIITKNLINQGIKGYWSGFVPWGVTLGFSKGFILGYSKKTFDELYGKHFSPYYANILAGISAGGIQGAFMSPLLLARTRVNQHMMERIQKNPSLKTTIYDEMKISTKILNNEIKNNGVKFLFTGMPMMIFKRCLDWGSRFFIMGIIRHKVLEFKKTDKLNDFDKIWTAYLSGVMSVSIAQPVDRLMPLIQQKNNNNIGLLNNVMNKIKSEGIFTMYRGWGVRSMQTGWHTMFAVVVTEKLFDYTKNNIEQNIYQQFNDR
jgi:hypothetical protein